MLLRIQEQTRKGEKKPQVGTVTKREKNTLKRQLNNKTQGNLRFV